MRYSGTERDEHGPWFTVRGVEATTTTLILAVWLVTLVIFAVEPGSLPVNGKLLFTTDAFSSAEIWRLVTWPFSHIQFTLGEVIAAGIFWLFGTQTEKEIGRRSFTILMVAVLLILPIVATIVAAITPWAAGLTDLRLFELTVVLLFIAERPLAVFFFGIPAWVIGAVIVALEIINDLHDRAWNELITILVSAALIAIVAKSVGMLRMYDFIPEPNLPSPRRRKRESGGGATTAQADPFRQEQPKRPGPLWGKRKEQEPAPIVPMPQQPRRRPPVDTSMENVSIDDIALDLLLDKIADGGMDSLTDAERRSLDELRARRRGSK